MTPSNAPERRFKALHRKLEAALAHIERMDDVSKMLEAILEHLCREFEAELGFHGGRIYSRRGEDFELCCGFGSSRDVGHGLLVPRDYPPHRQLLAEGIVVMARGDPGVDEAFEEAIGVESAFAAIGVGEGNSHIIAFSMKHGARVEDVLYSLSLVRHAINLKLQQRRMAGILDAARVVQEGILPREAPRFEGFDIAAASRPAEIVSGDLIDYLAITDCCIGIAIADSCGHGLPAALLARDVIAALRMAAGLGLGVDAIVGRVNGVLRHSALSGTFVSLFYGQLHSDGSMEYCNAGHEPPLLVGTGGVQRLERGGTVLGPIPTARYEQGVVRLEPGSTLVLYTDGIVERHDRAGEAYGSDRLTRLVTDLRGRPAQEIAAALLAELDAFAGGAPAHDDMTVLVVRRSRDP